MTDPTPLPSEVGDARRLNALHDYAILDTPPEKGFDDIVELARLTCAAPVFLVSLVAEDRQWFKARSGFAPCETTLDKSVCAHALAEPDLLVIPDLTQDPRTGTTPSSPASRICASMPGRPLRPPEANASGACA